MASAVEIRAYRDRHGCSLLEAKQAVERRDTLRAIDNATTIEDLKAILRKLVG